MYCPFRILTLVNFNIIWLERLERTKTRRRWRHLEPLSTCWNKTAVGLPQETRDVSVRSNRPRHSWAICRVIRIARWRRSVDGFFGGWLAGWLGSGWLLFGAVVFKPRDFCVFFLRVLVYRSWVNLLQPRSSIVLSWSKFPWAPGCNRGKRVGWMVGAFTDPKNVSCHPGGECFLVGGRSKLC